MIARRRTRQPSEQEGERPHKPSAAQLGQKNISRTATAPQQMTTPAIPASCGIANSEKGV